MQGKIRRVVTGHDAKGKAVIVSDGPAPRVYTDARRPGRYLTEVWVTDRMPASLGNDPDPTIRDYTLEPPKQGTALKILELPPDAEMGKIDADAVKEIFKTIGNEAASTFKADARHPLMHRTKSLDLGLVLSGEAYLLVDDEEVLMRPGDVVVQRGTNHAWSNRSKAPFRIAFFMLDAEYPHDLAKVLQSVGR
jgi:quercetin dioxygenase-like cupin family protein